MKVLCVGNQKGGVSKTTTSLNLCYSLAKTYNKKVLLIDMDSQGSASLNLQIDVASEDVHTIDELLEPIVLRQQGSIPWEALKECIYTPTFTDRVRDENDRMKWKQVNTPFGFDLTPSLDHSGRNVIAVATDNTSTRNIPFCIAETPNAADVQLGSYLLSQDEKVPEAREGVSFSWNCNDFNLIFCV